MSNKKEKLSFRLVNIDSRPIPINVETKYSNREYISYGENNDFPQQIRNLYDTSAIFSSVVRAYVDFVKGDGVILNPSIAEFAKNVNKDYENLNDVINKAIADYVLFGGFYIQVMIDLNTHQIVALYNLDFENCRLDKDKRHVLYSEKWADKYGRKGISLPLYDRDREFANSVFYFKASETQRSKVYPTPLYYAALKEIAIDSKIGDYFLNSMNNNFSPSAIINFNSGQVDEETADRLEELIYEKFCGSENAQKLLLTFNDNKDSAVTIERLESSDWSSQFQALKETIKESIYQSFRINPLLLGANENSGFATNEYRDAFIIFQRTVIGNIQREIERAFSVLFGIEGVINISEFSVKFENNNETNNVVTNG